MGLLDWLGAGKTLAEPIDAVGNALSKVVTTDKDRLAAEATLELLRQQPGALQVELNKINAQSARFFDSGWRPMIGWTAGFCFALYWVPQLILADYVWLTMCIAKQTILPFPVKSDDITQIIYLMLGFGTIKTVDVIASKVFK